MVKKISGSELKEAVAGKVAVVDFSAVWCGPCKMLAPVLEEVADEFEGKVEFFNVDVDESPEMAAEYGIQNIPALVLIKNGEKADQQIGFQPKTNIAAFIEANL